MANDKIREVLSAQMDNESLPIEDARIRQELSNDKDLQESLRNYDLIGKAIRKELPEQFDLDFSEKVQAAIEKEPNISDKHRRTNRFITYQKEMMALAAVVVVTFMAAFIFPNTEQSGQMNRAGSSAVKAKFGPYHFSSEPQDITIENQPMIVIPSEIQQLPDFLLEKKEDTTPEVAKQDNDNKVELHLD